MTDRVVFTPAAVALVRSLKAAEGPLIFHLSAGCCEGSAPMCLRRNDFRPGAQDVLLGEVQGSALVGASQYALLGALPDRRRRDGWRRRQFFA